MKYVIYYRVSTDKQDKSGLGLEAQQKQVNDYLQSKPDAVVIAEYVEIDSGKKVNRIELNKAVVDAKKNKAVLLVAKLDRVARNVKLFLDLLDQVRIEFTDLPALSNGTSDSRLVLTQLAAFAEWEAAKISERTKAALAAKKARGEPMGIMGKENIKATNGKRKEQANDFAKQLAGMLIPLAATMSQRRLVDYLNQHGVKSPTGKEWRLNSLQNVLNRAKSFSEAPR
ncbi:recombinase family protein [Acinetobacter wuhouensis]|uniref:Recombinase family protein n=1 Tax=Acinetobacter wuhouensis TaxID=1879050 RepID=A0A3G2SWV2_9GAMM|nr:recombinase family protein [Acinetobacter wuhouensis]AYO52300.1 recombinase family protein [Acinetobacter wuhouensis]